MEGLAIVSVDTLASDKLNPTLIKIDGMMNLVQPIALTPLANDVYRTLYDDDYFDTLEHQNVQYFLERYLMERNETLHYDYVDSVMYGPKDQSYIDIQMVIKVPAEQEVMYNPRLFQVLKMAWVQYFTIFLIFYVLLH